jgi:hypothetical protein
LQLDAAAVLLFPEFSPVSSAKEKGAQAKFDIGDARIEQFRGDRYANSLDSQYIGASADGA